METLWHILIRGMLTQNNRVSTKFEKSIPVVNVIITQTIE